jgi:hypothetical protein
MLVEVCVRDSRQTSLCNHRIEAVLATRAIVVSQNPNPPAPKNLRNAELKNFETIQLSFETQSSKPLKRRF